MSNLLNVQHDALKSAFFRFGVVFQESVGKSSPWIFLYYPIMQRLVVTLWGSIRDSYGEVFPMQCQNTTPKAFLQAGLLMEKGPPESKKSISDYNGLG